MLFKNKKKKKKNITLTNWFLNFFETENSNIFTFAMIIKYFNNQCVIRVSVIYFFFTWTFYFL